VAVAVSGPDARAEILGRIRAALSDAPPEPPPAPAPPRIRIPDLAARFAERVADYRATVTRCGGDDIAVAAAVRDALARHRAGRIVVAPGVPAAWRPDGALLDDPPLDLDALDAVDGALTGAALGIAETGTVVLDGAPGSGRRAITLVPDLHVCVVREADLVPDVPDAIGALGPAIVDGRPITLISGPSATSDIELERVEGVHGPRRLEVIIVAR
jgi:L-lactate dehydrogenase complex protein LldG